jgi:hypothetical protein
MLRLLDLSDSSPSVFGSQSAVATSDILSFEWQPIRLPKLGTGPEAISRCERERADTEAIEGARAQQISPATIVRYAGHRRTGRL